MAKNKIPKTKLFWGFWNGHPDTNYDRSFLASLYQHDKKIMSRPAKLEADSWAEIGDGEIYIFKYLR